MINDILFYDIVFPRSRYGNFSAVGVLDFALDVGLLRFTGYW